MDIDTTKYPLLLGCLDVCSLLPECLPRYHPILAGVSHYLLKDATITNCLKWILFNPKWIQFVCIPTVSIWYLSVLFELQ